MPDGTYTVEVINLCANSITAVAIALASKNLRSLLAAIREEQTRLKQERRSLDV